MTRTRYNAFNGATIMSLRNIIIMKAKNPLLLLGLIASANAAVYSPTGATYINSDAPDTTYSSGALVANTRADTPPYDRIPLLTFDVSSYAFDFDSITLSLSTGTSTATGFAFYYYDGAITTSTTWNTAATAGIVPSTADNTANGDLLLEVTGSYRPTSFTTYDFELTNLDPIANDSDGIFTIVVLDTNTGSNSALFNRSASLTVVPEPTSMTLLGLGALALVSRRKR